MVLPDFVDASGGDAPPRRRRRQGRPHLRRRPRRDGEVERVAQPELPGHQRRARRSVFSMPAYFNNTVYYGASGAKLKAFAIASARVVGDRRRLRARVSFTYPGTTPSISASGSTNGIVWAVENKNPAVLHAYDATNLAHELYNSTQAANEPGLIRQRQQVHHADDRQRPGLRRHADRRGGVRSAERTAQPADEPPDHSLTDISRRLRH